MANYTASTSSSGGCNVEYTNDASGRDVQIDYITVSGSTRQAESQATNTGVYQNSKCGGSNSEWLHCNGYIGFGNI
jgi:endo-1,4-beta-xylanase